MDYFRFEPLQVSAYDGDSRAIAVPSRLYYIKSEELPLNGHVFPSRQHRSAGRQDYDGQSGLYRVIRNAGKTAVYVKELIEKGAIIVGKTKLNAFAGSQKTPDHSFGAGACVAGYDWLDFPVGTDTTGSVREPARACGVWEICLAEKWARTALENVRDIAISDYLQNSGFYPLYYDDYYHYDEFRAAYKAKYGSEVYAPFVIPSFEPKYFASVLNLPQRVVPIGQTLYESKVSKRVENVPCGDLMLIRMAQFALEKAGFPTQVLTGRDAFALDAQTVFPAAKLHL
ncbi:hypothetical protein BJX99DRAFT_256248 [Aspergillus californicus]